MNVFLLLLGLTLLTSAKSVRHRSLESSVIKLDEDNYENVINGTKTRIFIRFFASWCPDCTAFTSGWNKVGKELKGRVLIADFDCAFMFSTCKKFKVTSYPTFLLFENAEIINEIVREITVKELIKEALVMDSKEIIKKSKKSIEKSKKRSKREVSNTEMEINEISAKNFKSEISGNITLTTFCVSWCLQCQKLMTTISELRKQLNETKIKISWIDCNKEENSEICFVELVNGVPMINLYCKGSLTVKDYSGSTVDELKDMVSSNCGDSAVARSWNERDKNRRMKSHHSSPKTVL